MKLDKYYRFRELYILFHDNNRFEPIPLTEAEIKRRIVRDVEISERTYIRYLQMFNKEEENFIDKYLFINAHSETKEIAASVWGFSRRTLHNKEQEILKSLIPFLQLNKVPDFFISRILNIQKNTLKKYSSDISFDEISDRIKELKEYIGILANQDEKEIIGGKIKTICKELEDLKKMSDDIFDRKIKKAFPKYQPFTDIF